jgi:hypothetical protein
MEWQLTSNCKKIQTVAQLLCCMLPGNFVEYVAHHSLKVCQTDVALLFECQNPKLIFVIISINPWVRVWFWASRDKAFQQYG